MLTFYEIYKNFIFEDFLDTRSFIIKSGKLSNNIRTAIQELSYSFADFGRWYHLRRQNTIGTDTEWKKEMVDFLSMFKILWRICKHRILRSFKEKVIHSFFNEHNHKFYFNQINEKFHKWLITDFTTIIVPEVIEKLKNNSIFKMGFMVKSLISEFLSSEPPTSYLKEIPLEEFYPPIQSFHINLKKEDRTKENLNKLVSETTRLLNQKLENLSVEDLEKMSNEKFFQGVSGVTDESQSFRIVNAEVFLDHVISTPNFFDNIHELNLDERKIPGILTVNSHASNLLQMKISEVIEEVVDDLVRYQNVFINCIKWEELKDFAK